LIPFRRRRAENLHPAPAATRAHHARDAPGRGLGAFLPGVTAHLRPRSAACSDPLPRPPAPRRARPDRHDRGRGRTRGHASSGAHEHRPLPRGAPHARCRATRHRSRARPRFRAGRVVARRKGAASAGRLASTSVKTIGAQTARPRAAGPRHETFPWRGRVALRSGVALIPYLLASLRWPGRATKGALCSHV
jgi:hypothetical protein